MKTLYQHMQAAVDIVGGSPHPTNKIATTIAGRDLKGKDFALSRTNYWPKAIAEKIGTDTKIGNSSGTIHAETACILSAPVTDGASVFITDPPCPNCVKNMAEAGIRALYIDHKGFDKDWAQRRSGVFSTMSMRICEKAGISVFIIRRKEEKLEPILEIPSDFRPAIEKPPLVERVKKADFEKLYKDKENYYGAAPFACALGEDKNGRGWLIAAEPHPVIGYTSDTMDDAEGKYSLIQQPVNRVLMEAAQKGLKINPDCFYSSIVPTARELVNMVGAGLTRIRIGDMNWSRDEFGPAALKQLQNAGILTVEN